MSDFGEKDVPRSQGQKRLAYVIHEAVCTAYKHEGHNALCDRAAIAVMASEWLTDALADAAESRVTPPGLGDES